MSAYFANLKARLPSVDLSNVDFTSNAGKLAKGFSSTVQATRYVTIHAVIETGRGWNALSRCQSRFAQEFFTCCTVVFLVSFPGAYPPPLLSESLGQVAVEDITELPQGI